MQGQGNDEPAAFPGRALNCHFASMSLHDVLYQRQSQSASLGVMYQGITHPIELLKNLELFLRGNSDSAIDDLKVDAASVTVKTNTKVFLVRRVLHRIVHQIQE